MIDVFTDGSCTGNPGPGGWGVLIVEGDLERELKGGDAATTNNRMEMRAAIEGLKATIGPVRIHTDSQYLKNGVTQWMPVWKRRGWRTADGSKVKNRDLWEQLDALVAGREVEWHWVRGHAGHPGNERADALARAGSAEGQPSLKNLPIRG